MNQNAQSSTEQPCGGVASKLHESHCIMQHDRGLCQKGRIMHGHSAGMVDESKHGL